MLLLKNGFLTIRILTGYCKNLIFIINYQIHFCALGTRNV